MIEVADRAATVAALRQRLARLGGLPGGDASPSMSPAARKRTAIPSGPPAHPDFVREGAVLVRRADIDLGPFLDRAGAPAPVSEHDLVALAYARSDPCAAGTWADGDVAVLDIETLGLRGSGVVAFLVGIGTPRGRRLLVDQLLLADPGCELELLEAVIARLARARLLVSYNGRTFDLPVLRSRCVVNRLPVAPLEGRLHCDLLAPVRRLFRDRLGSCTLRQAERELLGLVRENDVPGSEAPARYRAWLQDRGAAVLDGVVAHNQLDLAATMVLAARLAAHVDGRMVEPVHPADRYHLGAHLERHGVVEEVRAHYRAVLSAGHRPWDARAGHRLAQGLRRTARPEAVAEAITIWEGLWRGDRDDLCAARALAVALERGRQPAAALAICSEALDLCRRLPDWRLARLRGAPADGWEADWVRRRDRLTARLGRRARQSPAGAVVTGALLAPPLFAY